jgi:hypothetical protein
MLTIVNSLREHAGPLLGGYLAVVVAWSSLVDVLPLLLLDARVSSLGGYLATTVLSILQAFIALLYHFLAGSVGRFWVLWAIALSFFFFLFLSLFQATHH